jgi:hypothetical protein
MTDDFDLERLGDVWRQQPDPKELEELRRTAETVRRRARWAQVVDVAAAVLVAGVVLLLVVSNPKLDTLVVGGAAILVLLLGQQRQRRLRQEELRGLTGTSEQMLDQSIARIRTALKYNRFSLIAMGPAFLVGWLVASSAGRGGGSILASLGDNAWLRAGWVAGAVCVMLALAVFLALKVRRQSRELARLVALRQNYREETGGDDTDVPTNS